MEKGICIFRLIITAQTELLPEHCSHFFELGEKMPMTGVDEGNVTYPEFYSLSDGDLLFVYPFRFFRTW